MEPTLCPFLVLVCSKSRVQNPIPKCIHYQIRIIVTRFALISEETVGIRTFCCRCGEVLYCKKGLTLVIFINGLTH